MSLLPAATEIVAALGGQHLLVGISHECDYPPSIRDRPRLTASPVDPSAPGEVIDRTVRALLEAGQPVITVDAEALRRLRPDLVLTQELCAVCAATDAGLRDLAGALEPAPRVHPLGARTLEGIIRDLHEVGALIDRRDDAAEVEAGMRYRLRQLGAVPHDPSPRVVVVEWLEPLYLAGHWVPDLVAAAGGVDVGARPGAHSARSEWDTVRALAPDLVIVALCGFDLERNVREWERWAGSASGAAARGLGCPIWTLDGNAYTSRSGPRVVEGAELIQAIIRNRPGPAIRRLA